MGLGHGFLGGLTDVLRSQCLYLHPCILLFSVGSQVARWPSAAPDGGFHSAELGEREGSLPGGLDQSSGPGSQPGLNHVPIIAQVAEVTHFAELWLSRPESNPHLWSWCRSQLLLKPNNREWGLSEENGGTMEVDVRQANGRHIAAPDQGHQGGQRKDARGVKEEQWRVIDAGQERPLLSTEAVGVSPGPSIKAFPHTFLALALSFTASRLLPRCPEGNWIFTLK